MAELNVGRGLSGTRFGVGELRWNQTEALLADVVYFGRGTNGTGTLTTLAGETARFGTAADRVQNFRIAWNDSGTGLAEADIDLSVEDPFLEMHIATELSIGVTDNAGSSSIQGGASADGSLTLGSNSVLQLGSGGAQSSLNIGFNSSPVAGTATGFFDASNDAASVAIDVAELNVGRGLSGTRFGVGELRWNQTEALLADVVYFGRGTNGTGTLTTLAGETARFGTAADRVQNFRIAWNDSGTGLAEADIDLSVEDPFLEMHIATELSIGVTDNAGSSSIQGGASADGSLTLGSNSVLQLGSGGAQSSLNIGFNSSPVAGTATGFFDASNDAASVAIDVAELNVGRGIDENRIGVGELIVGSAVSLSADTANIGTGDGSSGAIRFGDQTLSIGDAGNLNIQILNFDGGLLTGDTIELDDTSGIFDFSGGTLAVDQFVGDLVQSGGVFDAGSQSRVPAADADFIGTTLVQGDYSANSAGVVRVDIDGLGAGIGHDQISILGVLDLNADSGAGAELEIDLKFVASLGDTFLFITNDGVDPIAGEFASLGQGDQFDEVFGGDTFTFEIDYMAGDGNDIELEVISIA